METTQATPPHDGGIYDLVDLSPPDRPTAPAVAVEIARAEGGNGHATAARAPAEGGLFARLLGLRKKDASAAPEAKPEAAPAEPKADPAPAAAAGGERKADGPRLRRKPVRVRTLRFSAPAWVVSALVHVVLLGGLGLYTFSADVQKAMRNLDAAMIDPKTSGKHAEELLPILADPSDAPRDQAVATFATATPGLPGSGLGTGSGPPSATPRIGARSVVSERASLSGARILPQLSGLALVPSKPSIDLAAGGDGAGGRGGIAGDVTFETKDVGQALDQVAREILRHLAAHKLTVVWLFDESGSMKDDQQAVKAKFDRITGELKTHQDAGKKAAGALLHAIVGFGEGMHYPQRKPTADIDAIGRGIDRLPVDETGQENVLHAIQAVINEYGRQISKERRLLIVLVTDESGDDGGYIEEARQLAVARGVPVYVIGRQSLFGYSTAHLLYVDPVTKDQYWPAITRGPETAGLECLQIDGLHDRWDEQPSGFAPYELARLAKDTGGIYFLLPSEENMRVRQREKAYSIAALKEYVPDYESRMAYLERRTNSELRRTLFDIVQLTSPHNKKDGELAFTHRRHYPIEPEALIRAIAEEGPKVQVRLKALLEVEKKLRAIKKYRDREPEKRWQAHYDLMLAQIVTYQVKAYEYLACLDEMVALLRKGQLKPGTMPNPTLVVEWVIDHSKDRKAPKQETEEKYQEAEKLLKLVIERHPNTPWADLAQDEFHRGFGCQRHEWHHNPQYNERQKLVPKY